MAVRNTTFTALTTGTRDATADDGAVYGLDGNTTNGRLNLSSGTTLQFGHHTMVLVDGNPSHTYMQGQIQADDFVYAIKPTSGNRGDFSSQNGSIVSNNMTYLYLGAGSIYNHLENASNSFTGFLKFIFDQSNGTNYTQFASREYANVTFEAKSTHSGTNIVYPARSSAGFTSLPGFKTSGMSALNLYAGTTTTSHGRIYDPVYTHNTITNNLMPLTVVNDGSGYGDGNRGREYFTIDVTAWGTTARARVVDSVGTVQFNTTLTVANCTIFANDGTTALTYYTGRKVIPCEVRQITNTQSTTRNTISYSVRHYTAKAVTVTNLAMNAPVVLAAPVTDTSATLSESAAAALTGITITKATGTPSTSNPHTITVTASANRTLDEIYCYWKQWFCLAANSEVNDEITTSGTRMILGNYKIVMA